MVGKAVGLGYSLLFVFTIKVIVKVFILSAICAQWRATRRVWLAVAALRDRDRQMGDRNLQ